MEKILVKYEVCCIRGRKFSTLISNQADKGHFLLVNMYHPMLVP